MRDRYVPIWRGPRNGTDSAPERGHNMSNNIYSTQFSQHPSLSCSLLHVSIFRLIVIVIRPLSLLAFGLSDPMHVIVTS
jgi:hypothetical protein